MDMKEIMKYIETYGLRLLCGILALVIGGFLIRWILRLIQKRADKMKMDKTAWGFLHNLLRLILWVAVVLTAANIVGIPLTSLVALIASAGVAVSLAMQGALSNLVGGLVLLILKPIRAGEYVKVNDLEGTIKTVAAFYTEMVTPDNRRISLPNSSLTNTAIVNYSREGTRRLDIPFSVSYESDMDQVYKVLAGVAAGCEKLLPDPAPEVHLNQCSDSSLDFILRCWCNNADYWEVFFFLTDSGKRALDAAGISIPYPQMDVHIQNPG